MPARDWDKARRYDKVGRYDPVESFKPRRSKLFKKLRSKKPRRAQPEPPQPTIEKWLQIVGKDNQPTYSLWIRKNRTWRCVKADQPFGWFTRLRHPDLAKDFLLKHHFQFNWLNAMPDAKSNQLSVKKASEERPAEDYTANVPSHAPAVNTAPSINNDTQADLKPCVTSVVKSPAASSSCTGAEWLNHASPLNCPAEPESQQIKA